MAIDVAMCPDCSQLEQGVESPEWVGCENIWHAPESKTPPPESDYEPEPEPEAGG